MRKARFTEHQSITVIKSVEAGRTVKDVCREANPLMIEMLIESVRAGHWRYE